MPALRGPDILQEADYRVGVIPRFREGEVLRVDRLQEGFEADDAWVVGQEGLVHSISSPNEEGRSWLYLVWIDEPQPTGRVLWVLDEENLTSLGIVEDEDGRRGPLPLSSPGELRDEIYLRLITRMRDAAVARRIGDTSVTALRALVSISRLDVEVERRHPDEPFHEIKLRLEVGGDVFAAFDRIVSEVATGWSSVDDDGWRCDAWWSRREAQRGSVFLAPEIEDAAVGVVPWETVARRSPAHRRHPQGG